jgi:putative sterol carrier protein
MKKLSILLALTFGVSAHAITFMSSEWADAICDQWNENEVLTTQLGTSFVNNDGGRGYKMLLIARRDCPSSPDVQITLEGADGMAFCVNSGLVTDSTNYSYDYKMSAKTKHWIDMGAGKYGPMKGMLTGRLKFKGPKMEAMKFMTPFKQFLLLTSSVESDTSTCPN